MKACLKISLLTCTTIVVLASACNQRNSNSTGLSNISYTNITFDDGSSGWVFQSTNGVSWVVEPKSLTLYFDLDHTLTVNFDQTGKRPRKIVLETPKSATNAGHWTVDLNADGIPDTRRIKGREGLDVFYLGRWHPSEPGPKSPRVIVLDEKQVPLWFTGSTWTNQIPAGALIDANDVQP